MIHSTAEVQTDNIGKDTHVWQYSVVLKGAKIGNHCNINCHVFIENDVVIGNHVTVKSGVQLWDGLRISDHVFIGPNVTFANDQRPRSKQYPETFQKTYVLENASLGAGCIVLGGITIGKFSMVGAGAVVTKDVPHRGLVIGNPGKIVGWLNEDGSKMEHIDESEFLDNDGNKWIEKERKLIQK